MDRRVETLLVLRAQSGDIEALDGLFRHIQERLYAYLCGLLADRHLAEDVLQEVFVLVHRKLLWLRDPELFRPWVHRIATREAFRTLRGRRDGEALELDEALDGPPPELEQTDPEEELIERLPQLVAKVSPASRPVLLLHYWEGLRLDEVAAVLELSVGTVKSRLAYGLGQLRQRLALERKVQEDSAHAG